MLDYLLFSILASVMLSACGAAQLNQGEIHTSRVAANQDATYGAKGDEAGSKPTELPGTSVANPVAAPAGEPDAQMPTTAVIPISIGGASLTCQVIDPKVDLAQCFVSSGGKVVDFPAKTVFFIDNKTRAWLSVEFYQELGYGAFVVKLPYGARKKSFAIAIVDAQQEALLDWIINPADPVSSLVGNGGFEAVRFTGSADYSTQFIDATLVTPSVWQVKSTRPGCLNILEISNNAKDTSATAPEGTQWTELDSSCSIERILDSRGGNNIILYQDLKVQPNEVYELTFQYRHRANPGILPQKFTVRFDGQPILSAVANLDKWQTLKILLKSAKANVRLEFEESGDGEDGLGTLLDDVNLRGFGSGPEAN